MWERARGVGAVRYRAVFAGYRRYAGAVANQDRLRAALLRASPAQRVRALTPVLAAADAALAELGVRRTPGAATAELVAAWERGETLDADRVAWALQSTVLAERDFGQGEEDRSMALQWVLLVQTALAEALGLDVQELLTRAVRAPDDAADAEPVALFSADDFDAPPDDPFGALLDVLLDDMSPPAPAVARALAEVAQHLE